MERGSSSITYLAGDVTDIPCRTRDVTDIPRGITINRGDYALQRLTTAVADERLLSHSLAITSERILKDSFAFQSTGVCGSASCAYK